MRGFGKNKATLTDVAREAGVSIATVDRVINGRGGVAPDKANHVLSVAKRLRLDRSLAHRPTRILRVGVLIQPPTNAFHAEIRHGFNLASRLHADLNLQIFVRHLDPNDPEKVAALVLDSGRRCDGIAGTFPDDGRVAAALREVAARIPVVTVADDVTDSGRAAYVGPEDRKAGRIAGDLMGRLLGRDGGRVIIILGLPGLRGHREREAGFRDVLAERHPRVLLTEVFESREDPDRAGLLAWRAAKADSELRGIYLATTGARPVVDSLRRLGRTDGTVIIAHELTDSRRELLQEYALDAVIDQNPALEAQVAFETMARLLGRLEGEPATTLTDFRIYMPENA